MNLIVKLPIDLKSALLALPALMRLKRHYDKMFIVVLASAGVRQFLEGIDCYDEAVSLSHDKLSLKQVLLIKKKFSRQSFDYFVSFEAASNWNLYFKFIGVKKYIGPIEGLKDKYIYNCGIKQYRTMGIQEESLMNVALVEQLGMAPSIDLNIFKPRINLENLSSDYFLIIAQPTNSHPNWSSRNFARLVTKLINLRNERNFVILHSKKDGKYMESFFKEAKKKESIWTNANIRIEDIESMKVVDLKKLMAAARAVIGHNTGLLHYCAMVDKPSVILNLPLASESVVRFKPFQSHNARVKLMVPKVVCGESLLCSGIDCPYYECMAKIEVKDVIEEIFRLIHKEDVTP